MRNLGELKALQSQMKTALHAAGMKTNSEKTGLENLGDGGTTGDATLTPLSSFNLPSM